MEVSRMNGTHRMILFQEKEATPRALAVNPIKRSGSEDPNLYKPNSKHTIAIYGKDNLGFILNFCVHAVLR